MQELKLFLGPTLKELLTSEGSNHFPNKTKQSKTEQMSKENTVKKKWCEVHINVDKHTGNYESKSPFSLL